MKSCKNKNMGQIYEFFIICYLSLLYLQWPKSMLISSVEDPCFNPGSGQIFFFFNCISCFSTKHVVLNKNKYIVAQSQDSMSLWNDNSTCGLLFQWDSTINSNMVFWSSTSRNQHHHIIAERSHNWLLATITHFLHQMLKYDKIFQYLSYNFLFKELGVMHVWYTIFSFIDRGNWILQEKPSTYWKLLTDCITFKVVSCTSLSDVNQTNSPN
jgi:hypothetical protein